MLSPFSTRPSLTMRSHTRENVRPMVPTTCTWHRTHLPSKKQQLLLAARVVPLWLAALFVCLCPVDGAQSQLWRGLGGALPSHSPVARPTHPTQGMTGNYSPTSRRTNGIQISVNGYRTVGCFHRIHDSQCTVPVLVTHSGDSVIRQYSREYDKVER